MRLDKFIAESSALSRKEIKRRIKDGRIAVDGAAVTDSGMRVEESAVVTLDGERIYYRRFVYIMLNKPAGCVSAVRDKRYPTVTDYLPEEYAHYELYPVGRLDLDTEGLLILTNDGMFAHEMTSPHKDVYKRYFARLSRGAEESDIETFASGMDLGDFVAKPAKLEITENPREVYIEIAEGKFHQVKRMCDRIGKSVEYLKRVRIGSLSLDPSLEKGETRELTEAEIALLVNKSTV